MATFTRTLRNAALSYVVPTAGSFAVHGVLLLLILGAARLLGVRDEPPPNSRRFDISIDNPAVVEQSTPLSIELSSPAPDASTPSAPPPMPVAPAPTEAATPVAPPRIEIDFNRLGAAPPRAPTPEAPAAPPTRFAGLEAESSLSIVYAVDASNAMITSIDAVKRELIRSISALAPTQHFQVVLFRNRPPAAGESPGQRTYDVFSPNPGRPTLLQATAENKAAARKWIESIRTSGFSNPSAGLRRALLFKPDAVFLLARSIPRTEGTGQWDVGKQALLEELANLNPIDPRTGQRRVAIKTIQFIEEDPTGIMQAIGEAYGGKNGYTLRTLNQIEQP